MSLGTVTVDFCTMRAGSSHAPWMHSSWNSDPTLLPWFVDVFCAKPCLIHESMYVQYFNHPKCSPLLVNSMGHSSKYEYIFLESEWQIVLSPSGCQNHTVLLWSVQWEVVALGSLSGSVTQFASVARQRGMFCKSLCGQIKVKFSPPVTVEKSSVFTLWPGLNRRTPLSAMGECKTFTSFTTLSPSWFHCRCGRCWVS